MPFYRLLGLRYLRHRWDRAALIVASIALGVATLVSSRILNQCIETAAAQTTTPLGVGDLFVKNGELGVPRAVADDVRAANVPGVKAVQPLVVERITLPGLDGRYAVLAGVELSTQMLDADNPLGVRFTRTLERDGTPAWLAFSRRIVVLSKPVYDDWVARRADTSAPFVVRFGSRPLDCVPVGYIEFDAASPVALLGRNVVGMKLEQAARFVRPGPPPGAAGLVGGSAGEDAWDAVFPPRVQRIDVILDPGANPERVRDAVRAVVGDRATVETPKEAAKATQEIVSGIQAGFALCSAAAMVVGLFLVYNALAVTIAERRHDIGVLRSLGATRGQIVGLFGALAAVLGLFGAAAGLPLGVGMARAMLGAFHDELSSMFVSAEIDPGRASRMTRAVAAAAGVVTAVVAALIPAVQAAAEDPAGVVRRTVGAAGRLWRVLHRAAVAALVVGGVGMILSRESLPPRVGAFVGMLAALVGLLLAAPILVGGFVRLIHPILRRVLPFEARLAADNLLRAPGRTGVVIGALGAGVAVMVQTAGVCRSNEAPILEWVDEVIQADRFVFAGSLATASSSQTPMEAKFVPGAGQLPGVAGAVGLRYAHPEFNGTRVLLVALDAQIYAEHTAARHPEIRGGLERLKGLDGTDRVLVSDNFARKHGVQPGDGITLPGQHGPVRLGVAGTVRDYSWSRGTIFMDRPAYARVFGDDHVDVCHVFLADGPDGGPGGEALAKYAADAGLVVMGRPEMRKFLADLIDRIYVLAYLQQIVVGVVAALGVVTTLLISVLQRKRELGLLLAVGATPGQVVRSVMAEAVMMGLIGTLLGVLIGVPLEWYALRVVLEEESGFAFDLMFPWGPALGIAAGSLAVATVAGLLPALHAVRLRIVDAIAYE